jgi:hypothetical protein
MGPLGSRQSLERIAIDHALSATFSASPKRSLFEPQIHADFADVGQN